MSIPPGVQRNLQSDIVLYTLLPEPLHMLTIVLFYIHDKMYTHIFRKISITLISQILILIIHILVYLLVYTLVHQLFAHIELGKMKHFTGSSCHQHSVFYLLRLDNSITHHMAYMSQTYSIHLHHILAPDRYIRLDMMTFQSFHHQYIPSA